MQVHHSNHSNKYDGFKVPLIFDSKAKTSKVKPRVIPNMASAVVITELSDDHDAEVPPPLLSRRYSRLDPLGVPFPLKNSLKRCFSLIRRVAHPMLNFVLFRI